MKMSKTASPRLPGGITLLLTYRRIAVGIELPISLAGGLLAFFVYVPTERNDALFGALYAELQAAAALLGIVLAALAVVVAFLGDAYLAFLTQTRDGADEDYEELHRLVFVFWFTCIIAVVAVMACLFCVWLLARGFDARVVAGASTFFFFWALLASLGLVRFVAQHLLIRSAHLATQRRSPRD